MAASLVRRRIVNVWAGSLAGLILLLGSGSADVCAIELIENGSFEDLGPDGPNSTAGWDDGPGNGNDKGFASPEYPFYFAGDLQNIGSSFELPPDFPPDFTGFIQPFGAGVFFGSGWGAGNGNGRDGSATQMVDLSGRAERPYAFSAWVASSRNDAEYAVVSLEFFTDPEGTGSSISSIAFDGSDQMSPFIVGSMNLDGFADPTIPATDDNWTLYRAVGTIPSTAESAAVVIRGVSPHGSSISGNDGFVDLVSLRVVPEPASISLACSIGFLVMAWAARRRGTTRLIYRTSATRGEP